MKNRLSVFRKLFLRNIKHDNRPNHEWGKLIYRCLLQTTGVKLLQKVVHAVFADEEVDLAT